MSCRLHNGLAPVEQVAWPTADGSPALKTLSRKVVQQTLDSSGDDAQMRVAELEHQLEKRVREAHAAGAAEGRRAAAAELDQAMQRAARSVDELARLKAKLRKEAEADLVKLTLAVAQRILRRELTVDEGALHGIINSALERIQLRDIIQVRTHPAHESVVRQAMSNAGAGGINIILDKSLQVGDLLFDSARGSMDASIDSQLVEIERGFADVLGR